MDLRDQIQTTLGDAYTVERELGGGGMSHVFVATERSLGRRIVVKVLPPESVAPVALERFKREIKVAASLQHPHIVPLLSAGDIDGLPYFTMPFVKGESLRERLVKSGELSVKDTLHVLRDVASALAYAHADGVVHRDIKPDNIMLSGGVAVVTDFGVAKAVDVASTADGTHQSGLTSLGVALGTPAYMAPEQASADPHVDHRADIYSFGCVAYEVLAGSSPFAGRPMQQMLAAHVNEQPESLIKRRPAVPPALAALIMKCLEKRPGDRPQSASELLAALDAISTPSGGMEPTSARLAAVRRSRVSPLAIIAASVVVVAASVGIVWARLRGGERLLRPGRVTPVATSAALEMSPAISPDGKFVAFMQGTPGSFRIMVRQITGERSAMISGELASGSHEYPRWSPDGSQIAFEANGNAYVVPATGGAPKLLVANAGSVIKSPCWSPDGGQIAYSDDRGLWVRSSSGGEPREIVKGGLLHSIAWSPDGRMLAYVNGNRPTLDNQSSAPVWVVVLATGSQHRVSAPNWINLSPTWLPDSRALLYISSREGTPDVFQQAIAADGAARGAPQRLTAGLGARTISLSGDGTRLAYDAVRNQSNLWTVDIPVNGSVATAPTRQITSESQRIEGFSLSHDGQWLAFDSNRSGNFDIYRVRIDSGEPIQVTTNPANDFDPSWSPDDGRLLFHSARPAIREIYSIGIDGSDERKLTDAPFNLLMPDVSPDGRRIVAFAIDGSKSQETLQSYDVLYTQDAAGQWSSSRRLTPNDESAGWARWSPDGRWVAYVENSATPEGKARIIGGAGGASRIVYDEAPHETVRFVAWGRNPSELFVDAQDSSARYSFYSVPLDGGKPRLLFRDSPEHRIGRADFASDGRRLFVTIAADESDVYTMELTR